MYKLLFATPAGEMFDYPALGLAGRLGDRWVEPEQAELIPLPEGATLTLLPGRHPVGLGRRGFTCLERDPYGSGRPALAVAALLPQGYTRTLLPAYAAPAGAPALPLLGYAAVGVRDGRYYVAALPTDEDRRWNPRHYNTPGLAELVGKRLAEEPENRILRQLARCSLDYGCFTAQNVFYRRWEGGIPFSPACNARCLGCISLQPAECCPAPQARIDFSPSPEEAAAVATAHLTGGGDLASFGQGCEGEPTLRGRDLERAVALVRRATGAGTINVNTNASRPEAVERLAAAGVDSFRVSLNSARPDGYAAYYRPRHYSLRDVRESLWRAARAGAWTALNWLVMPGFSDRREELDALVALVEDCGVRQVQLRNLNLDPDLYLQALPPTGGEPLGVPAWLETLRRRLPGVRIGSYSRPLYRGNS